MRNLLPILGLALALPLTSGQARTISLPDKKPAVHFDAPKGWSLEEIERGVSLESPDKEATILLEITPEAKLESLIQENTAWLKKEQKVVFDEKSKSTESPIRGGAGWQYTSWKVDQADWGKGRVIFGTFHPNPTQTLMVTYWVTTEGEKLYGDALQSLFASVKSTTEASETSNTTPADSLAKAATDAFAAVSSSSPPAKTADPSAEIPSSSSGAKRITPAQTDSADPSTSADPSLLIGMWLGNKYISFYDDGRYGLQKYEGAPVDDKGRSWSLKGNKITWGTPDDTFTETIVTLTRKKLVIKDAEGSLQTYKRIGD